MVAIIFITKPQIHEISQTGSVLHSFQCTMPLQAHKVAVRIVDYFRMPSNSCFPLDTFV